jgi:asparagine N-glycosylation enzyme membrane subunit Stt3
MKSPTFISIWQATHKQLLRDDTQYRKRFHSHLIILMCLSCLLLPFYLPFFGIRLFGFATDLGIILSVGALIVFLALRQFYFQNQKIRQFLKANQEA